MKNDFTIFEKNLIDAICSLYEITAHYNKDGVFHGYVKRGERITLNGRYFLQLLNSSNVVYLEMKEDIMILTILAQ